MGQQIRRDRSIAAATSENVMSGQLGERLSRPSVVRFYAAIRTAGAFDVVATCIVGQRTAIREGALPRNTDGVLIPDHQVASLDGLPGDQVFFDITNQNAATARDVSIVVDVEEVI